MRARWIAVAGMLLAFILTGLGTAAAHATAPVQLDPGFVTDRAGVLSNAEVQAAEQQLAAVRAQSGADLYVVFVDHFTSPTDRQEWADQVAALNNLGPLQYLLAIAVEGRAYYISADSSGPVSEDRLNAIEGDIRPHLSDGDWAGAIAVAADGFIGSGGPTDRADGASSIGWIFPILIVVFVALFAWLIFRNARKGKQRQPGAQAPDAPTDPYAGISDQELEREAGSALVQTDDALTSSREEVGFATAQFGDASTAAFTRAVEAAHEKLSAAFALKQKLDDEVPDTPEQRRAWHIQIIQLCAEANDELDANVEAFEALRKLEQDAPAALERVIAQRAAVQTTVDAAPAALESLRTTYAPAALTTVEQNPAQARERLALADSQIAIAQQKLSESDTGEAAFAIRTAEEAVLQAGQLASAVTELGSQFQTIEQHAQALIADLEADLAAAAQLEDRGGQLASVVAHTRSRVEEAGQNLRSSARDPQRVLEALTAANTQIDESIAQVRTSLQQAERTRQMLQQTMLQAQSQIAAAQEYITTRRGAVGATARTRLAEAGAALAQAQSLQHSDPQQALQLATRANDLAKAAISAAQSDISGFNTGGGGGLGSDIVGGILGGLIASGMSGGSSRRSSGGWGGSSRSGWRSSGGGSRGFRPSSFGGSRGRSGGGRF